MQIGSHVCFYLLVFLKFVSTVAFATHNSRQPNSHRQPQLDTCILRTQSFCSFSSDITHSEAHMNTHSLQFKLIVYFGQGKYNGNRKENWRKRKRNTPKFGRVGNCASGNQSK